MSTPNAAALTVFARWLVEVQPPVVAHQVGAGGVAGIGQTALGGGRVVCGLSECLAGGGVRPEHALRVGERAPLTELEVRADVLADENALVRGPLEREVVARPPVRTAPNDLHVARILIQPDAERAVHKHVLGVDHAVRGVDTVAGRLLTRRDTSWPRRSPG